MITPGKAQQDYRAALTLLEESAAAPGLSPAERVMVRDAIRELTAQDLDRVEAEISALTRQYAGFIRSASGVIESLKEGAALKNVLSRLAKIVAHGTKLIGPDRGARAMARGRRAVRAAGGPQPLRILCVHGVGHQENDPAFESSWTEAITTGLIKWTHDRPFEIQFVAYDDLFAANPPDARAVAEAMVKLTVSGVVHGSATFCAASAPLVK